MMILKRIVLPFILALTIQIVNAQTNNRTTYNFNSDWKVIIGDIKGAEQSKFDDKEWKTVTLPRAFNEDEAFRLPIHEHSGNIVWYRKYFKLPESGGNEKVFLEFEGIRQGGEFYLNGEFIGRHENGVMAFGFDISDKLLPNDAENVLAVRVDNAWDYREKSSNSRPINFSLSISNVTSRFASFLFKPSPCISVDIVTANSCSTPIISLTFKLLA